MRFHTALRAPHHGSGFGNVEFFPVTEQERLALTGRQLLDFLLNQIKQLCLLGLGVWTALLGRTGHAFQSFQRVRIVVIAVWRQRGEQGDPQRPDLSSAEKVTDRVLQDALEEERQLGGRLGPVLLRKAEHCVLHDIQRGLLVPDGEQGLLECPPFDAGEEVGEFAARGQGGVLVVGARAGRTTRWWVARDVIKPPSPKAGPAGGELPLVWPPCASAEVSWANGESLTKLHRAFTF